MSFWLVAAVTAAYFVVGVTQLMKGSYGFGIMWFGYASANVGIILAGGAK